jgi:hypothetical protein
MRPDSAVEPTKSENTTVTWRRSAVSLGDASTATCAPTAPGTAFAVVWRFAIARCSFDGGQAERRVSPSPDPSDRAGRLRLSRSRGKQPRTVQGPGSAARPRRPSVGPKLRVAPHHHAVRGKCPGSFRSGYRQAVLLSSSVNIKTVPKPSSAN